MKKNGLPDMRRCMSPAFSSTPSLNQESLGCGTPITWTYDQINYVTSGKLC